MIKQKFFRFFNLKGKQDKQPSNPPPSSSPSLAFAPFSLLNAPSELLWGNEYLSLVHWKFKKLITIGKLML
jgi:hypothetical protein